MLQRSPHNISMDQTPSRRLRLLRWRRSWKRYTHEKCEKAKTKKEENILDLRENGPKFMELIGGKSGTSFKGRIIKDESLIIAGFFLRAFRPEDNAQTAGE